MRLTPRKLRVGLAMLVCSLWGRGVSHADVRLPAFFSNNMVVQQGMEIPVWGKADPGERVAVAFQGQTVSTVAEGGKWIVRLKPLRPGGPGEMTVKGKNTITIENVLVGEVWVCGGQSNMGWAVQKTENPEADIANSANPQIRYFKTAQAASDMPLDDVEGEWQLCGPETVPTFAATAYYFGRALQKRIQRPVGLIKACAGGTSVDCWISHEAYDPVPEFEPMRQAFRDIVKRYPQAMEQYQKAMADYPEQVCKAQAEGRPAPGEPDPPIGPGDNKRPCAMYNGMIRPLQPYAIKGAIWYQGEYNTRSTEMAMLYRKIFPAVIQCWRNDWGQGDFPFLFVQLAGLKAPELDFPALRESQLKTLSQVRYTGMAVAIDLGDENNVHARKKRPVGERLALVARAIAYGEKIECSGPLYDSMKIEGEKAILRFTHVGGGLEARGGELRGLLIASEDRRFVPASARIENETVVVFSPNVAKPAAVRYAWASWPDGNLFNSHGLPASPFRTDEFPLKEIAGNAISMLPLLFGTTRVEVGIASPAGLARQGLGNLGIHPFGLPATLAEASPGGAGIAFGAGP